MIEFTPIPVGFELERFGSASIDLHEWMRLRKHALEFVVGKGVNATSFTVLHTEVGFANLPSVKKLKDSSFVLGVVDGIDNGCNDCRLILELVRPFKKRCIFLA